MGHVLFLALCFGLLCLSASQHVAWAPGREYLFRYNSTAVLASQSTLDGERMDQRGQGLRVLAHVSVIVAEDREAEQASASGSHAARSPLRSSTLLRLNVAHVRFQRHDTSSRRFQTFPTGLDFGRAFLFSQSEKGEVLETFYDASDSDDVIAIKKGIARAFHTFVASRDSKRQGPAERMVSEVTGQPAVLHRYHRTEDDEFVHVRQTRHGLFAGMDGLRDGFEKRTLIRKEDALLSQVVIIDDIARSDDNSDQAFSNAWRRAHGVPAFSAAMAQRTDASDSMVSASAHTTLTFVFSRPEPKAPRPAVLPLVADTLALASALRLKPNQLLDGRRANMSQSRSSAFWHDQVRASEACLSHPAPISQTRRVACFMGLTAALDHLGNDTVIAMYQERRRRVDPTDDSSVFLDALVSSVSHQAVANGLIAGLLGDATLDCPPPPLVSHALFAVHSLVDPSSDVAAALRSVTRLAKAPSCTDETRDIATLAYGSIAHATRNTTLRLAIQLELLERLEATLLQRGPMLNNADNEVATLVQAVGNAGHPASLDVAQRTVAAMASLLQHEGLEMRQRAVFGLRFHVHDAALDVVRSVLQNSSEHAKVRYHAARSLLHQVHFDSASSSAKRLSSVLMLDTLPNARVLRPVIRGQVGDAVSLLQSLSYSFSLGMKQPFEWDKFLGASGMGMSVSAYANNYLNLVLSPLNSSMHLLVENHASVTANLFGQQNTVVAAAFDLEASFSYNLNTRFLKQLAEAEALLTSLVDGTFFDKAKAKVLSLVAQFQQMTQHSLFSDTTLVDLAKQVVGVIRNLTHNKPFYSPVLTNPTYFASTPPLCQVVWDVVLLLGDLLSVLPPLLKDVQKTVTDSDSLTLQIQTLRTQLSAIDFPSELLLKVRDLSCRIPDLVSSVQIVLSGNNSGQAILGAMKQLIAVYEDVSDILALFTPSNTSGDGNVISMVTGGGIVSVLSALEDMDARGNSLMRTRQLGGNQGVIGFLLDVWYRLVGSGCGEESEEDSDPFQARSAVPGRDPNLFDDHERPSLFVDHVAGLANRTANALVGIFPQGVAVGDVLVSVMAVGGGSCTIVSYLPAGANRRVGFLLDLGSQGGPVLGVANPTLAQKVQSYLDNNGIDVHFILPSHRHADHVNRIISTFFDAVAGGNLNSYRARPPLPQLFPDHPLSYVIVGALQQYRNGAAGNFLNALRGARGANVCICEISVGEPWTYGARGPILDCVNGNGGLCPEPNMGLFQILAANNGDGQSPNRDSVVWKLTYSGISVLFPGDFAGEAVDELAVMRNREGEALLDDQGNRRPNPILASNIYIAAHHGATTDDSNSADWIAAVHPQVMTFSAK